MIRLSRSMETRLRWLRRDNAMVGHAVLDKLHRPFVAHLVKEPSRIGEWSMQQLDELLPHRWAAARA